jgi:hypothetical protein
MSDHAQSYEVYDIKQDFWTLVDLKIPIAIEHPIATPLPNNEVLIIRRDLNKGLYSPIILNLEDSSLNKKSMLVNVIKGESIPGVF